MQHHKKQMNWNVVNEETTVVSGAIRDGMVMAEAKSKSEEGMIPY